MKTVRWKRAPHFIRNDGVLVLVGERETQEISLKAGHYTSKKQTQAAGKMPALQRN